MNKSALVVKIELSLGSPLDAVTKQYLSRLALNEISKELDEHGMSVFSMDSESSEDGQRVVALLFFECSYKERNALEKTAREANRDYEEPDGSS